MNRITAILTLALLACIGFGCATRPSEPRVEFFSPPQANDPFYPKITDWQQRQRLDPPVREIAAEVDEASLDPGEYPFGLLRGKFERLLNRHKRRLAREFTEWSQRQARMHYKPDADTTLAGDHWPTLREFFETNGDDCDGLDLIAYGLLRESGFREGEIYRLIVRRDSDGANHMVSVWFEDPEDPWVIDATGAMSREMLRYSKMPEGWTPRMMFNETAMYNVIPREPGSVELAREPESNQEVVQ
jgi:hypothetical protein